MDAKNVYESYVKAFYKQYKTDFDGADAETAVDVAVDLAYRDAQRTMNKIDNKMRDSAKENVSNAIKAYLKQDSTRINEQFFDEEHKKICNAWCNAFKEKDGTLNKHGNYGKAQKIVNMAFKYLYCYYSDKSDKNEIESKKEYFEHCHFTLDSFTLKWLNGCGVQNKPSFLNSNLTWSSGFIPEKVKEGDYSCKNYEDIQRYARTSVKKVFQKEGWTALQAEFFIWDNVAYYDCLKTLMKFKKTNFDEVIFSQDLFKNMEEKYPSINKSRGLKEFIEMRKKKLIKSLIV